MQNYDWKKQGPSFNQWNLSAAALGALFDQQRAFLSREETTKTLFVQLDARNGSFRLFDAGKNELDPARFLKSLKVTFNACAEKAAGARSLKDWEMDVFRPTFGELTALIEANNMVPYVDTGLKYLLIKVDTATGDFTMQNDKDEAIAADRVFAAAKKAAARFNRS